MKRLYVPDVIYDQVIDALAALTAKIPMGPGLDEGNVLGPLQNQMQWNVVNRLVEDAKARGARVVMGGDPDAAAPGFSYPRPCPSPRSSTADARGPGLAAAPG